MERIYNHLGAENLKEMAIRCLTCDADGWTNYSLWIDRFAEDKSEQGTNICIVGDIDFKFRFWAGTSDTRLLNFIRLQVETTLAPLPPISWDSQGITFPMSLRC